MRNFVLASESMTEGHPDKLCDQISDALVDACLASDPEGGLVAECALTSGVAFLSIRHRRALLFDPTSVARRVLREAGYESAATIEGLTVMLDLVAAPELPSRASPGEGASHMSTAFGYACGHTAEKLPYAIWAAHRLSARLDALRREGEAAWLSPDAQVQVAVRFEARQPVAISDVALTCAAGSAPATREEAIELFQKTALEPVFSEAAISPDSETRITLRQAPRPGGPRAHAGLTGRKTADDCYGGYSRHPSSALSGKDPGRIERIAAYAARQAALSVLAAGLAEECEVQLSYAPGETSPISLEVDCFGSGQESEEGIAAQLGARLDFRPAAIVERLDLWRMPERRDGRFYRDFAAHGHFGRRDLSPPWEQPAATDGLA